MVCKDCEKKLGTVITPDVWKDGAQNAAAGAAGRKVGQNMLLKKPSVGGFGPSAAARGAAAAAAGAGRGAGAAAAGGGGGAVWGKCGICKQSLHQAGAYCNNCAYQKGICSMCGKAVINTKFYKQSTK